jgi:hypothetical protein
MKAIKKRMLLLISLMVLFLFVTENTMAQEKKTNGSDCKNKRALIMLP